MKINLTPEQQKFYDRFIRARNKMRSSKWIPRSDVICTVDVAGMNHPLYVMNDDYLEYQEAFKQWLAVEPKFREKERMRSSRGDYGQADSWEEKPRKIKEL